MKILFYQVNAFIGDGFKGNPAGVCMLEEWLDDRLMQSIALENNLSETAFIVKSSKLYHIRWFTPKVEVDLCGHATLASAHIIMKYREQRLNSIQFKSKSGELTVEKKGH